MLATREFSFPCEYVGDPVSLRTDSLLLHLRSLLHHARYSLGNVSRPESHCHVHRRQNMKRHLAIWGLTASVLVSFPLSGTADDQGGTKQSTAKESQSGQVVHTAVYQPPRKGAPAPGIRRGGGTRGPNK